MESKEQLLAKIEILDELFRKARSRTRALKLKLTEAEKNDMMFGGFEDGGSEFSEALVEVRAQFTFSLEEQIRLEKTKRFFKHRLCELKVSETSARRLLW